MPQIREMLKDSSSFVRRAAVDVFIKLGSKEDLKSVLISLISQACKDPNILKYLLRSIILLDEILYSPFKKENQ